MKAYTEIPALHNVPVLVRSALNVPIAETGVAQEFRLRRALPTIKYLREQGARVIVAGHIGQEGTETLLPVVETLRKLLGTVAFSETATGPIAREAVRALLPGEVLVLENLRRNPGEVAGDRAFAMELASLADVFVQDSFDTCHRVHASIVRVPEILPSYAGWEVREEVQQLGKALMPERPSLAIVGGAKFSTKEPVLSRLLDIYDHVFVGGALANDFLLAKGLGIGRSLVSHVAKEQIAALLTNPKLVLPVDGRFVKPDGSVRIGAVEEIAPDEAMLDCGPKTVEFVSGFIKDAKTILWNGPLGLYEKGFVDSTDALARAIAETSAYSVVGGGDTVAELERISITDRFSFVSTGGGAMLDYLAKGTLPGLDALH